MQTKRRKREYSYSVMYVGSYKTRNTNSLPCIHVLENMRTYCLLKSFNSYYKKYLYFHNFVDRAQVVFNISYSQLIILVMSFYHIKLSQKYFIKYIFLKNLCILSNGILIISRTRTVQYMMKDLNTKKSQKINTSLCIQP